ncbi:MAG: hypothetical protein LBR44_10770 [Clostridiales Family XIII bacterium]|jgi:hypothetical protein|nr:hypothetical protein [Clostridiales Family XIII bacterium]
MERLFGTLFTAIRSAFSAIYVRVRMLLSPTWWRTTAATKLRSAFSRLLNVKPRDKNDYYGIFRWLVSKRLAFAAVVIIGVASLCYILLFSPVSLFDKADDGALPAYKYNSLPIKLFTGQCRIQAKGGYVAYEGAVEKGVVKGSGTLYARGGGVVYTGAFDNNMYNGTGVLFYEDGTKQYEGDFLNNQFHGEGTLYAPSGSMAYAGAFANGLKDGEGILYNASATPVYQGSFSSDRIQYQEFVGKTAEESAKMYTGRSTVYSDALGAVVVDMEEIGALYAVSDGAQALDGAGTISSVIVLADSVRFEGEELKTIGELTAYFGAPDYAGFSWAQLDEAVAVNALGQGSPFGAVALETEKVFDDAYTVTDFDRNYEFYVYAWKQDGILYTFYTEGQGAQSFAMYAVSAGESKGGAAE